MEMFRFSSVQVFDLDGKGRFRCFFSGVWWVGTLFLLAGSTFCWDGRFLHCVAACEVNGHSVFLGGFGFLVGWEGRGFYVFFSGVWWVGHLAACCTLVQRTYLVRFRAGEC